MTTLTALAVKDADPQPGAADPAAMRQDAARRRGEAALIKFRAATLETEARQLEHDAALWEKADAAEDALTAVAAKTSALEAAVGEAVAAEREAADHLRKAKARLAIAKAAEARADERNDLEASEGAAARAAKAAANAGKAQDALVACQKVQAAAEEALDRHRQEVRGAEALFRAATADAMNPSPAPGSGTVSIEFGKPEGLSPLETEYVLQYVLSRGLLARAGGSGSASKPSQATSGLNWRSEVARVDPEQARVIRQGTHTTILPAVPAPGR